MPIRLNIYPVLLLFFLYSVGKGGDGLGNRSSPLTLGDVMTGIKARTELLESVHITFDYRYFSNRNASKLNDTGGSLMGMPLQFHHGFELYRHSRKMLVKKAEYIGDQIGFVDTFAWDGRKHLGFRTYPGDPKAKTSGSIKSEKSSSFKTGNWLTPFEQEVFDLKKTLPDLLDQGQWVLSGPESIGQYSVYRVECKDVFADGVCQITAWVDPTKDFAPVQLLQTFKIRDRKPIINKMVDVCLEQRDGVWVITDAVLVLENQNVENTVDGPTYASRVSVKDYLVDVKLPEDFFELEFPKGTRVYDEIIKTGYIVGEGIWISDDEGMTEFVRTAPLDVLDDTALNDKKPPVPPGTQATAIAIDAPISTNVPERSVLGPVSSKRNSTQSGWLNLLIVVIILLLLCGTAYSFYHRAKREKNVNNT